MDGNWSCSEYRLCSRPPRRSTHFVRLLEVLECLPAELTDILTPRGWDPAFDAGLDAVELCDPREVVLRTSLVSARELRDVPARNFATRPFGPFAIGFLPSGE